MLTQDDYKLYTGETSALSTEDWEKMVGLAVFRLENALCLEELPTQDGEIPEELKMVLANFICLMLAGRGRNLQVSSKKVRNFTISYNNSSVANAFSKLQQEYGDILGKYSQCRTFIAERPAPRCPYGCF